MDYLCKTPRQLGQILKGLRRDKGITQAQAGSRIGLRQSEISSLEADPSKSSLERLFRLASTLELDFVVRDRTGPPSRSRKIKAKRGDAW